MNATELIDSVTEHTVNKNQEIREEMKKTYLQATEADFSPKEFVGSITFKTAMKAECSHDITTTILILSLVEALGREDAATIIEPYIDIVDGKEAILTGKVIQSLFRSMPEPRIAADKVSAAHIALFYGFLHFVDEVPMGVCKMGYALCSLLGPGDPLLERFIV